MPLYQITDGNLSKVAETTFAAEKIFERKDLQRLLKSNISALGDDLMVISEEFGDWEDSKRRIDLLCLDKRANVVVAELKRTEDGGHMELQALRYAAMVASMTLERAISTYARYLQDDQSRERATAEILEFLDAESIEEVSLTGEVRILLVSADFSSELTTAVIWLNKQGLDITCIRFIPYRLGESILIDVSQIIPLPEAADYEVKIREQSLEVKKVKSARHEILRKFWGQLIDRSTEQTQILANRSTTSDQWINVGIGRVGFTLGLVLTKYVASVECYIRDKNKPDQWNTDAFNALKANSDSVEAKFGKRLIWDELPNRKGCRISFAIDGGWQSPLSEWPELQKKMISALIALEAALKPEVQKLSI
jgi:hypothetical protein